MPTPEKHALLSASSAARWLHCTAAPRFEEQFPENTSEYAEEGRLAHAICELKVLKHFTTSIKPRAFTQKLKKQIRLHSLLSKKLMLLQSALKQFLILIVWKSLT